MNDHGLAALLRGCEHVYSEAELRHKLARAAQESRPLRVKLGMDPTAPDIHLGHSVVLRKLRQFQDLGHRAVLIIGDFTARIGDPTGGSKTRPILSEAQIAANAQTYLDQAGKILDTAPERFEIRRNSEWLDPMSFTDVVKLAAKMTVGQMLKREDFRKRFDSETPISLHELLYPLVQGWDSVNIRADVELGGTDQTYNNLVGRDLQADAGQEPQVVMILPILRGLDGVKKMSKSLGNYIGVTFSPRDIFGKTMSIPDELLTEWYRLLTDVTESQAAAWISEHPMQAKERLARMVGSAYCPPTEMDAAALWWREHFSSGRAAESVDVRVPAAELDGESRIAAWKLAWLAHGRELSNSEARRLVKNGAFEFEGEKILDPTRAIAVREGQAFRAGRHRGGERAHQPLVARIVLNDGQS